MSSRRQLIKAVKDFYQQLRNQSATATKEQSHWVLRTLLVSSRRPDWVNSGFVLPTVALVALVVVLLTTAILFRAFDRSKNASNVRVNQAVMAAATPALDRAKAKIDALFKDPRLPRSTPSDLSLDQVITANRSQYTLGDETPLTLKTGDDTLVSAWKYPVDTNNNGKFDSYTIYAIYFRTPKDTTKPRSTLEARTQPMANGLVSDQCKTTVATSADLVKAQGWYKVGSKLKRSIFVYTTTVPITDPNIATTLGNNYETYSGNKSFAALEYQQDRERIPLSNNAVLYNDDLSIAPFPEFKLNGRVVTNSNLLTRQDPGAYSGKIRFYQVSSPASCYFQEDNGKIVVGGNIGNSNITDTQDQDDGGASHPGPQVDLFSKSITDDTTNRGFINKGNKTTPNLGSAIAYNSNAFEQRIALLVSDAKARGTQTISGTFPNKTVSSVDPKEVQDAVKIEINTDANQDDLAARDQQLDLYFRKRTRRVPYIEVPLNSDATTTPYPHTKLLSDQGNDSLRPQDNWVFPFDPANGTDPTNYAKLAINPNATDSTKLLVPATDPQQEAQNGGESLLGDRVLVGNNLPQLWWNGSAFVSADDAPTKGQTIANYLWDTGSKTRMRYSRVKQLDDLGATNRDGFWEKNAAEKPQNDVDVVGGLRVVTGAGIYLPQGYTPTSTNFTSVPNTVWSDAMAVATTTTDGLPSAQMPYLQMRATAVYHYAQSYYDPTITSANPQTPIACVSSYYDPTNSKTAQNQQGLPDVSRLTDTTGTLITTNTGNSNNGVVYAAPTKGVSDYKNTLTYQANLKYPNGRWVNEQLQKALNDKSGHLTLAEKSAIDSEICALGILDKSLTPSTDSGIPHGAIRETAFLDARQIKAISRTPNSSKYDLDIALRQPLEIRATVLDMNLLRTSSIAGGGEKLLPNSGIIYATRDDALPDASDTNYASKKDTNPNIASSDSILDPTRRPHGIMLINGQDLSRSSTNNVKEKGLILASNLPVYIKGNFNKHLKAGTSLPVQEFTNILSTDWGNFYKRGANNTPSDQLDPNFACRKGQFNGCDPGDSWRPASVLADAVTILSNDFQLGYRNEGDYNLRDNVGSAPLGYHYNTLVNKSLDNTTPISLNENLLQLHLTSDPTLVNAPFSTNNVTTANENYLGVDLDGDDMISNPSVTITEQNMPGIVAARLNGFWDNNFVTSFPWRDAIGAKDAGYSDFYGVPANWNPNPGTSTYALVKSSYFNNLVTPVQRRLVFPEYVMEICHKRVVSACLPDDWMVGYDTDPTVKANKLTTSNTVDKLLAGTTARPPVSQNDYEYPRRIAFLRDSSGQLMLTSTSKKPIPLGIKGKDHLQPNNYPNPDQLTINPTDDKSGTVWYYPYEDVTINTVLYSAYSPSNRPRLHPTALYFKTDDNSSTGHFSYNYPLLIKNITGITGKEKHEQPLLVPVLQLQYPKAHPPDQNTKSLDATNYDQYFRVNYDYTTWMQRATASGTETNLVIAQGDVPARPNEGNGGLENFVRYLEVWRPLPPAPISDGNTPANNTTPTNHQISGSFIQLKRSVYATGPWQTITTDDYSFSNNKPSAGSVFGYPQGYATSVTANITEKTLGRSPFYSAPQRQWGFDVALLTQLPDLFSQRFTVPPTNPPNEYFREVGRDDPWVATLLCGATSTAYEGYETAFSSTGVDFKYGITKDQRPSQCQ